MTTLAARLIVFFAGIPAIGVLIALPFANHLGLNLAVTLAVIAGSAEMVDLLERRGVRLRKSFVLPVSAIAPVAAYLDTAVGIEVVFPALLLLPLIIIILRFTINGGRRPFEPVLAEVSGAIATVIYPGYLAVFLVRMSELPYPVISYVAFFSIVFANDTSAYVFGMLFGSSSRGVSRISPGKSLPGFIAGPAAAIGIALLFHAFRPELFSNNVLIAIAVGVLVGLATIIGDLFESVLKRSAGAKDSGVLIPGRGGVLDSIDSIIVSAPCFYFILRILS